MPACDGALANFAGRSMRAVNLKRRRRKRVTLRAFTFAPGDREICAGEGEPTAALS